MKPSRTVVGACPGNVGDADRDGITFDFAVVFWGREHRQYFVDLLLASLLADGNLPAIGAGAAARLLICTPRADWLWLQEQAHYRSARGLATTVWLEMDTPTAEDDKMRVMSRGHARLTQLSYEAGAVGVFLTPDVFVSNGFVSSVRRRVEAGYSVVLAGAVRFRYEGFYDELVRGGYIQEGQPIAMSSREMVAMGLRHLHSETRRFELASSDFAVKASAVYWRVPDGSGIVMLCFSWAPVAVSYSHLREHRTDTFDKWTMDGDYVHANFGSDLARIAIVDDSDELFMITFTPESEHTFLPLQQRSLLRLPLFGRLMKLYLVRHFFHSHFIDPLKRELFVRPVRWHATEIDDRRWLVTRARARAFAELVAARGAMRGFDATLRALWNRGCHLIYERPDATPMEMVKLLAPMLPPAFLVKSVHRAAGATIGALAKAVWRDRRPPPPAGLAGSSAMQYVYWSFVAGPESPELFRECARPAHRLPPHHRSARWPFTQLRPAATLSRGRWYWEVTLEWDDAASQPVPVVIATGVVCSGDGPERRVSWSRAGLLDDAGSCTRWGRPCTAADDVIRVALDVDAGQIWFGVNDTWFEGGDPARARSPAVAFDAPVTPVVTFAGWHDPDADSALRWRQRGDSMAYAPPSGFLPLADSLRPTRSLEVSEPRSRRACTRPVGRLQLDPADIQLDQSAPVHLNRLLAGASLTLRVVTPLVSGRYYWEAHFINPDPPLDLLTVSPEDPRAPSVRIGLCDAATSYWAPLGADSGSFGWRGDGYLLSGRRSWPAGEPLPTRYTAMRVAVDLDVGRCWLGLDERWLHRGEPGGDRSAFSGLRGPLYPAFTSTLLASGPLALSLALAPGHWLHAPPPGFVSPLAPEPVVSDAMQTAP